MAAEIITYLDEVKAHLHLDPHTEGRIISELATHFQEKVTDLSREGVPEEQAEREAVSSFGRPRAIARMLYEAHSQGTWVDTFISAQPHIIAAALFVTHLWRNPLLLSAAFALFSLITILAWRHGPPTWVYSWVGYAFYPLIILAFLSRHMFIGEITYLLKGTGNPPGVWTLVGLTVFYAFALWIVVTTIGQVARRDWILVSLLMLPLPVLGIWAFTVEQTGDSLLRLLGGAGSVFDKWDSAMASLCMILGVTSALFIRLRQRVLKAGAVILIGILSGAVVVRSVWSDVGFGSLIAVSLVLFVVLVSPFFLHNVIGHTVTPKET